MYQQLTVTFCSFIIQDEKLLKELKRLKRLRWYKVAKLMGEGANATSCHDRWVELTEVKETPDARAIRRAEDEKLNVWSEYEVSLQHFSFTFCT